MSPRIPPDLQEKCVDFVKQHDGTILVWCFLTGLFSFFKFFNRKSVLPQPQKNLATPRVRKRPLKSPKPRPALSSLAQACDMPDFSQSSRSRTLSALSDYHQKRLSREEAIDLISKFKSLARRNENEIKAVKRQLGFEEHSRSRVEAQLTAESQIRQEAESLLDIVKSELNIVRQDLNGALSQEQRRCEQLEEQVRVTESENMNLRQGLTDLRSLVEDLKLEREDYNRELGEVSRTCDEVLLRSSGFLSKFKAKQQELTAARSDLQALEQTVQNLRRELDTLEYTFGEERRSMGQHLESKERECQELRQVAEKQQLELALYGGNGSPPSSDEDFNQTEGFEHVEGFERFQDNLAEAPQRHSAPILFADSSPRHVFAAFG